MASNLHRNGSWCLPRLALLLMAAVVLTPARANTREYEIKAAYLYNFINYIDWVDQSLVPAGGTITIGVFGENPFGPALVSNYFRFT